MTHTHTSLSTHLLSQISLVAKIESCCLHYEHHNIDNDGHVLVVSG